MKTLDIVSFVLLVIGGLNWGLVGLFDFNLVSALFGVDTLFSNFIYVLVGAAALYEVFAMKGMQRRWTLGARHEPAHMR